MEAVQLSLKSAQLATKSIQTDGKVVNINTYIVFVESQCGRIETASCSSLDSADTKTTAKIFAGEEFAKRSLLLDARQQFSLPF